MRSIHQLDCGAPDVRLVWISLCVSHVQHPRRRWKGTILPVVEEDTAEYGGEEMAYANEGFYWGKRLQPDPRLRDSPH
jgi:hypothetical protein